MVLALLAVLFLTLVQGAIAVHARNAMIDAASAGARYGALADRTAADGVARAEQVLAAGSVTALGTSVSAEDLSDGGTPVLRVTVTGTMPVLGLWHSPIEWEVHGHAFRY
ncbi:pilus assembly protein TadE [Micrococcus sp. HMSC067E09]|nr:pilus assembly protein TadE [Micrococcus sp. HMSC067E09]